ncbi:outer membrane lipoprotein chaperone LolA [Chitinolyticbacter meiyuanensis]|uniref:outer membrane lipoprotein chaperone LolA n=1 Tax=Chitinolyticbacter meiyuanensis TaxID=682798 RepID=UPI0011E5A9FD|nr:outer membrane lipoprotein chaperone LolA [Chitinolyticbacter meiyuanensis]
MIRFLSSSLFGALLVAAPVHADDALATLKSVLAETRTLQGSFSQTVSQKNGKPQQSRGELAIERPGKFRWSYSAPYEQLIVGDGSSVWLYDPDLRQATVKSMGAALESSPAALLAGDNALERNYSVKLLPARNGLNWLEAIPKSEESGFASVRLGLKGRDIVEMELVDRFDQLTRLRFDNLKRNGKIDPALFRFTPPKGVDVVRE